MVVKSHKIDSVKSDKGSIINRALILSNNLWCDNEIEKYFNASIQVLTDFPLSIHEKQIDFSALKTHSS